MTYTQPQLDTLSNDYQKMPITVSLHPSHIGKGSHYKWAEYQQRDISTRQLAIEVYHGHPFTNVFNGRRRCADFVEAWVMCLDFDTEDERSQIETLREHQLIDWFGSFIHSTWSSTKDKPRSRVVFCLQSAIKDIERFKLLGRALAAEFPACEATATRDATKIWSGCNPDGHRELVGVWSFLPDKVAEFLIDRYIKENPPKVIREDYIYVSGGGDYSKYIEGAVSKQADELANTPSGQRHHAVFEAGAALGSLVGATWAKLGYNAALDALMNACDGWPNQEDIERTIRNGLDAGMTSPRPEPMRKQKRKLGDIL